MQIQFNVRGMTCHHCQMAVTAALKKLVGVREVRVDLDLKKVTVDYEENKVHPTQLKEAIEDIGYDVT